MSDHNPLDSKKQLRPAIGLWDSLLFDVAGVLGRRSKAFHVVEDHLGVADLHAADGAQGRVEQQPEGPFLAVLAEPFSLGAGSQAPISITASIGIAAGLRDTAEEFLRDADVAMYTAKGEGKSRYAVFGDRMRMSVVKAPARSESAS